MIETVLLKIKRLKTQDSKLINFAERQGHVAVRLMFSF